ncbi:glycosyltransferase [Saccharothrix espanaensis]|uniref:Glycosyltransferase, family 2 n=1 Tax=Saccharothrix espanaensis (strain ATCC 51144 / DSM 44229 / JCM 9112 / NBRC 15066 / NRRL 15764) TaxID=1179773 RepID=K0JV42_SACES|nr:glycosyltransferase [Saccharothrix espanaensis]CCH29861.1 Glycosyltransferase, family 2 [Saccharothrix espanaensis DSM 44229]
MPLAVVIVTYHSADVVQECLESVAVALESIPDGRVVVVDNASTDDTLDVVARTAPNAQIVARVTNDGFAAGVNAGFAAAPDCDVLVLNPDIRLEPGALGPLREALAQPGVGIAAPRLLNEDGSQQLSLRRTPNPLRALGEALLGGFRAGRVAPLGELVVNERSYERTGTADWVTGAAWLVSRACRDAIGKLEEQYFLYSEETEYMLRAGKRGFAIRFEPRSRAVHLGGEQSTSPVLWSMATTNRVRLIRERHGRPAAFAMWWAVLLNELLRAPREPKHRKALGDLLRWRKWPARPGQDQGWICFSAQDWWYHNRAHSDFQLMRSVAQRRKVLVVNSIGMRMPTPGNSTHVARRILRKLRSVAKFVRKPLPNFYVMSPLPLPFYGSPFLRKVNAVLVRTQVRLVATALRMRTPVIMVTIPTAWDVVQPMRKRSLVFNRSDRHSDFPEADRRSIEVLEHELLAHSDHVVYVSHALMDEERPRTGDRTHFLDHGVDIDHFTARPESEWPDDIRSVDGPRIGFFGALDDFVVDFDLLERLAAELPTASLVLIGDATHPMERFDKYPNVHWLGFRPYDTIPAYGSAFDVAIMPWQDNNWIKHSNPIKLKEYLALGLPVVSTDFAELATYTDRVRATTGHAEFVDAVRRTLAEGGPRPASALRASVTRFSWHSRAAELVALAEG